MKGWGPVVFWRKVRCEDPTHRGGSRRRRGFAGLLAATCGRGTSLERGHRKTDSEASQPSCEGGWGAAGGTAGTRAAGLRGVFILLDGETDCPAHLGPTVQAWATEAAAGVPCGVVLAQKEYEAWFLASIESLRGYRSVRIDAEAHPDPERPRDAKAQLEARMEHGATYLETADQPAFSGRFSLPAAYRRSRSFRKLKTRSEHWSAAWAMTSRPGRHVAGPRVRSACGGGRTGAGRCRG